MKRKQAWWYIIGFIFGGVGAAINLGIAANSFQIFAGGGQAFLSGICLACIGLDKK